MRVFTVLISMFMPCVCACARVYATKQGEVKCNENKPKSPEHAHTCGVLSLILDVCAHHVRTLSLSLHLN